MTEQSFLFLCIHSWANYERIYQYKCWILIKLIDNCKKQSLPLELTTQYVNGFVFCLHKNKDLGICHQNIFDQQPLAYSTVLTVKGGARREKKMQIGIMIVIFCLKAG